tara:strand:- start:376 stop:585 length:210 start_codon:yes stop_codon:yes gene_type:complete
MSEILTVLAPALMNIWLIALLLFGLWFVADDFDPKSRGNWVALARSVPPVLWALWLAGRDAVSVLSGVI